MSACTLSSMSSVLNTKEHFFSRASGVKSTCSLLSPAITKRLSVNPGVASRSRSEWARSEVVVIAAFRRLGFASLRSSLITSTNPQSR